MITFGYNCPHCGVVNSYFAVRSFFENKKYDDLSIFSIIAICSSCDKSISADIEIFNRALSCERTDGFRFALTSQTFFNLKECVDKPITFYPNTKLEPEIPDFLPDEVLKKMRAAEKLFIASKADADMLEFAGNAYRSTLEVALALLDDNKDKNLKWRINSLVTRGILVKSMGEFADRIRLLGNQATHDKIDLSLLEELRLFSQLFLKYVFTLPAMIPKHS